jgi:acyl carrier protein
VKNIREIIISAIHESTGFLNDPKFFKSKNDNIDIIFSEIDIDSLSRFEIVMHIEEALDIELDSEDVFNHQSLFELEEYLNNIISA